MENKSRISASPVPRIQQEQIVKIRGEKLEMLIAAFIKQNPGIELSKPNVIKLNERFDKERGLIQWWFSIGA